MFCTCNIVRWWPLAHLQAVDMLLERMQREGFPFGHVISLSGCGQQHGSVYWKKGSENVLRGLNREESLSAQLKVL